MAQEKLDRPSGSSRKMLSPKEDFLIKEMSFLQSYTDDDESRTTSYTDSNTDDVQRLLDEFANEVNDDDESNNPTPSKKQKKDDKMVGMLNNAFQKIDSIIATCNTKQTKSNDFFYNFLEQELEKYSDEKIEEMKNKIIKMVLDGRNC